VPGPTPHYPPEFKREAVELYRSSEKSIPKVAQELGIAEESLRRWIRLHEIDAGESEGWIKDFKRALKADRLSCHRFFANQFRLLLHAAAYWLLDEVRRKLVGAGVRRMQLDTLRLLVVKIGGRVRQLLTKIRLHLSSGHPGQRLWQALSFAQTE